MIKFKNNKEILFSIKNNNKLIITDLDKKYYLELIDLVNKNRCHYSIIIKRKSYKYLYDWILLKTSNLVDSDEFKYNLSTRVYWVLDGILNFPKCLHPDCQNIIGIKRNISLRPIHNIVGYPLYCSSKCKNSSPIVKEHRRLTIQIKYGVDNVFQNDNIKQKCKKSHLKNLGVDHPSKSSNIINKTKQTKKLHIDEDPKYYDKITNKIKQTKIKNQHSPNWNNREKAIKTYKEKTGYNYPSQNPSTINKIKQTNNKKYNCDFLFQNKDFQKKALIKKKLNHTLPKDVRNRPDVKNKIQKTCLKKYGSTSVLSSPKVRQKIKQTNIKKYGSKYASQNDKIKNKIKNTRLNKYGVTYIPSAKYIYYDQRFDSAAELAFWIYNIENNIKIYRCGENDKFKYISNNKQYFYYPDFKINEQYIEIKGDHFFKSDGTMYCPYRYKYQSNIEYQKICQRYNDKYQCMIKNNILILKYSSIEVQKTIDYVNKKYGKKYLEQFRLHKS